MSRQLWLLRHGDAEPHGARVDSERRLTPRGEEQSSVAGAALAAMGVDFALVFASPKVRARDTAERAVEPLGVKVVEHEVLASGFDRDDALELVRLADDDQRVLVVGHEPDFSQVVHDLTGARIDLKKGGAAAVKVTGSGGELIALLRPAELEAMGG